MPLFIWLREFKISLHLIFFSFFFFPTCVPRSCPELAGPWWAGKERWGCACGAEASCCSQAAARTWFACSRLHGTLRAQGSTFRSLKCHQAFSTCLVLHACKTLPGCISRANVEYLGSLPSRVLQGGTRGGQLCPWWDPHCCRILKPQTVPRIRCSDCVASTGVIPDTYVEWHSKVVIPVCLWMCVCTHAYECVCMYNQLQGAWLVAS